MTLNISTEVKQQIEATLALLFDLYFDPKYPEMIELSASAENKSLIHAIVAQQCEWDGQLESLLEDIELSVKFVEANVYWCIAYLSEALQGKGFTKVECDLLREILLLAESKVNEECDNPLMIQENIASIIAFLP